MLLAAAAALATALGLLALVLAVRDDLSALRARVAGHERELQEVRRLAARLRQVAAPAASDVPLLPRLEAVAGEAVGHERIAALTPDGDAGATLQVSAVLLASLVRLLHALEAGTPALPVTRFALRQEPDDPARFSATLEIVR
jgi:hypothetical protein